MVDIVTTLRAGVSAADDDAGRLLSGLATSLFYGFLEAAPDAVVVADENGIIVQVNRQAENLFGFRRDELIGGPVEVLMPERFRRSHVDLRQAYCADPRPRPMGGERDLVGLRKDGHEFPIDVLLNPLLTGTGVLVASAIRDMTPHRRLEDQLRERTRDLEDADRQKDHFLSAVAHELRSPLAVLTQVAHILRSPHAGAADQHSAVGALERQTSLLVRLVEDLLDLSRVRRGQISLREQNIDLRTVVLAAVEISDPLITSRKHHLAITQPPNPVWVSCDPTRLAQVLSNLLSNAAKFTSDEGHICVTVSSEGQVVEIRIRDDGRGIPQELLTRVFDLFAQGNPIGDHSAGGLGIGLTLVRRLVEMHRGSVAAFSDGPGCGSEFVVRLPLLPCGFRLD